MPLLAPFAFMFPLLSLGLTVSWSSVSNAGATAVIVREGMPPFSENEQIVGRVLALYQTYKIQ